LKLTTVNHFEGRYVRKVVQGVTCERGAKGNEAEVSKRCSPQSRGSEVLKTSTMLIEYPLRNIVAGSGRGQVDVLRAVQGVEDGTIQELGSALGVVKSGNIGCWSASCEAGQTYSQRTLCRSRWSCKGVDEMDLVKGGLCLGNQKGE
jgi:hypothetical protein